MSELNQEFAGYVEQKIYKMKGMNAIKIRATNEEKFKERLYSDPSSVATEYGISMEKVTEFIETYPKETFIVQPRHPHAAKLI